MTKQWSRFRGVLGLCAALGLIAGCMTQIKDAGDDSGPAATSDVQQDIGGGGGSGPTIPPPDCSGKPFCYCACRVRHPCATNGAECGPLAQCLNGCDASYPTYCAGGGNPNPRTLADCL
jgi:hypothetical protein